MISKYTEFIKNKNGYIFAGGILLSLLISILLIFCLSETKESKTLADESFNTASLSDGDVYQSFIPQNNKIKSISIDIGKNKEHPDEGRMIISLCNTDLSVICSVQMPVSQMKDYALTEIETNWEVLAGVPYFLKIEWEGSKEGGPLVHYRDKNKNNPAENLDLYFESMLIENGTLNVCYLYSVPMGKLSILYTLLGTMLIGLLAAGLVDDFFHKKAKCANCK